MIKNLLTLRHAIIVCLACLSLSAFAQEGDPRYVYPENCTLTRLGTDYFEHYTFYICKVGDKVGVVDEFKHVIIPIEYDAIKDNGHYNDYFYIRQKDNWGLITPTGEFVIPPVLASIRCINLDQYEVKEHDGEKNTITRSDFNLYGVYVAKKYNWGKWFFIREDENTKIVYMDDYWTSGEFNNGLMPVFDRASKKLGFINTKGEWAIPCKINFHNTISFAVPGPFFQGGYLVVDDHNEGESGRTSVYTPSGKKLWSHAYYNDNTFYTYSDYVDGGFALQRIQTGAGNKAVVQLKYISPTGAEIFPNIYAGKRYTRLIGGPGQYIRPMKEGMIAYADFVNYNEARWGFFDKTGKIIVKAKYNAVHNFREGLAAVQMTDDAENALKWGFIDKTGAFVIPPRFSKEPTDFHEGLAVVQKTNGSMVYIDKKGKVVSPEYALAEPFLRGTAFVEVFVSRTSENVRYAVDHAFNAVNSYLSKDGFMFGDMNYVQRYKARQAAEDYQIDFFFRVLENSYYDSRGEEYYVYGAKEFTVEHVTEGIVHVRFGPYGETEDYFCDQTGRVIFILRRNEF